MPEPTVEGSGDIGHLVDFALMNVEHRFFNLRKLCDEIDVRKCTTTEEIKATITELCTHKLELYGMICKFVLSELGVTNKSSPAFKLLEGLSNNVKITLYDVGDEYKVNERIFMEVNHSVHPHPFIFNPGSAQIFNPGSVQILSEEMAKALRRVLEKL